METCSSSSIASWSPFKRKRIIAEKPSKKVRISSTSYSSPPHAWTTYSESATHDSNNTFKPAFETSTSELYLNSQKKPSTHTRELCKESAYRPLKRSSQQPHCPDPFDFESTSSPKPQATNLKSPQAKATTPTSVSKRKNSNEDVRQTQEIIDSVVVKDIEYWKKLGSERGPPKLTRTLARPIFGIEKLKNSTVSGQLPPLGSLKGPKLDSIKRTVKLVYNQHLKSEDFDTTIWKRCTESLGQLCKQLRTPGRKCVSGN